MINTIKNRRSIRKYKDIEIEKETLDNIIKAALMAPSSMNKKPIELIIIREKEILDKLKKCKNRGTIALETCNVAIVVIGDSEKSDVWVEDASIVSSYIQLEAESLDLGSCWIQLRNRTGEEESSENEVRKVLNIPSKYGVLSIITLGYKDEEKEAYNENAVDLSKVHYNKY